MGAALTVNALAALALLAAAAAPAAAATVYRWVDEQGRVHFSDRPPPGGGERLEVRPAPAPGGAPAPRGGAEGGMEAAGRAERQRRLLRAFEAERREREAARARAAAERRRREARCRHARRRLALYERVHVVYETDAKGRRRALGEAERAARIRALRAEIARWCEDGG